MKNYQEVLHYVQDIVNDYNINKGTKTEQARLVTVGKLAAMRWLAGDDFPTFIIEDIDRILQEGMSAIPVEQLMAMSEGKLPHGELSYGGGKI